MELELAFVFVVNLMCLFVCLFCLPMPSPSLTLEPCCPRALILILLVLSSSEFCLYSIYSLNKVGSLSHGIMYLVPYE